MKIVGNIHNAKHYGIQLFFAHTEDKAGEPVMYLRREVFGRGFRYGLTVDEAHNYWQDKIDNDNGWDHAKTATLCIGLDENDKRTVAIVASIIEGRLSDLLTMKPLIKELTTEQMIEREIAASGLSGFSIKDGEGRVIAGDG